MPTKVSFTISEKDFDKCDNSKNRTTEGSCHYPIPKKVSVLQIRTYKI
jgi:hypothetical protein